MDAGGYPSDTMHVLTAPYCNLQSLNFTPLSFQGHYSVRSAGYHFRTSSRVHGDAAIPLGSHAEVPCIYQRFTIAIFVSVFCPFINPRLLD